ncbi:DUF2528 family protein [Acinetobacter beijerinckii]|uniref:DUF2528 family protein n=1 Tax=Acinetobacter beijerinckii TaxID=262668 RepID=UPI0023DDEBCF|nr:DUF2528 family protein [Acinetobacter beijerinckii]MDF2419163.1 DUF2528 family protein [Acinetobacter beijerinckii]
MQNDSTAQTEQAEIPAYLQCEPRTFEVKYDKFSDVCDLEFTIVIKCTDDELHEHNNFWSGHKDRLNENNGDIVAVMLKMIARDVFYACFEGKRSVGYPPYKWGINTIFQEEGWGSDCFEITKLWFESYVSGDDFEFEPVVVEG